MPTQKCYPLRLRITFKKKWQKYVGIGLIKKSILKFFLKTIKIVSFSFAYERERGREIYDFFTFTMVYEVFVFFKIYFYDNRFRFRIPGWL